MAFPGLSHTEVEGGVCVENPVHGTRVEADPDLLELLSMFRAPTSLASVREHVEIDEDDLAPLLHRHLLVREDELDVLTRGFLRPAVGPPLGASAAWHDVIESVRPGDRVVFGAPVDVAAGGSGGARHGPREVRHGAPRWLRDDGRLSDQVLHLDLQRHYETSERQLFDLGDVHHDLSEPYATFGRRVGKVVNDLSARGAVPILLGGDHSVSWFALEPLLTRHERLGVVHFDAHHDLYPTEDGQLRHLNPFHFVCQHDALALLQQIGLRTSEAVPTNAEPFLDERIRCVSSFALKSRSPEDVLGGLPRDLPYYLSFDVDCLDPAIAPETGTTVVGGMSYYEALALVDYAARELNLVGVDFVEVTASERRVNMAAHIVGELLGLCVLGDLPYRPLETYYYRR